MIKKKIMSVLILAVLPYPVWAGTCSSSSSAEDPVIRKFAELVGGNLLETPRVICSGQALTEGASDCSGAPDLQYKIKEQNQKLMVTVNGMSDPALDSAIKALAPNEAGMAMGMKPTIREHLKKGVDFDAQICEDDNEAMTVVLQGTGVAQGRQIKYIFKKGENGKVGAEQVGGGRATASASP